MRARKPRRRPTYPSAARQAFGLLLTLFTIACLRAAVLTSVPVKSPGSILLFVALAVTYLSGLRAGMISTFLSLGYLLIAYAVVGSPFHYLPAMAARIISAFIIVPALVLLVGVVQNRLRNAGMREFDAQEAAEAEARQRKETEDTLRDSEEMRRLVVESSTDAIVVTGQDGAITFWNGRAEEVFGWTTSEAIGRDMAATLFPNNETISAEFRKLPLSDEQRSTRFDKRLELRATAKRGREVPIELTVVPHEAESGKHCICFIQDLSEQHKLNERLRQAQKMEALGTLAAGIAHDFNNILAAVAGNLTIARGDLASDHIAQESLMEAETAVKRASGVVAQILTFSSAKATKSEVIDVAATLHEAIRLLRSATPATMSIDAEFTPDLPPIKADSHDIHQIVLNLGINAWHALQGNNGVFEIRAVPLTLDDQTASSLLRVSPGAFVRISFGDTGCGMDEATQERIFEPFFTTKAPGEGTGLGLSMVFGIVERHGGAITVTSEVGKGTVFHLYFPAVARESAPPAAASSETELQMGHGERILYVDDDETLVYMMTRLLRRRNYEVVGFQHPGEALAAFRSDPNRFDLAISDMSMPHIDGPALVRQLRQIRPDLPVILVTGYIRPKDLEQAQSLGVRELLLKPTTVSEMSDVLQRVLTELQQDVKVGV